MSKDGESEDIDVDYMYYICRTLLGWTDEEFMTSSLKHISNQINMHIKFNNSNNNEESSNQKEDEGWESFSILD